MKHVKTLFVVLILVAGCSKTHSTSDSEGRAEDTISSSPYHLRYKSWSGVSPGAGFTHTSLIVVDLNLPERKIRKLIRSASRPDAMLPHADRSISVLLGRVPWQDLPAEKVEAFDTLIRAWLATSPPSTYNSPMGLGREDGHMTQLSVSWDTNTITTKLNVRGGISADDPLRPPKEWKGLVDSLVGLRQAEIGELRPVRR